MYSFSRSSHVLSACSRIVAILSVHLMVTSLVWGQEEDSISKRIAELQSPKFENREIATRELVLAGPAAVEALAEATQQANLELALRAIEVLHQMCLAEDEPTWQGAEGALRKIAAGDAEVASRCATDILSTLPDSALARLGALGARVTSDGGVITLDANWQGKDEGLVNLRWIPKLTTLRFESAPITDAALRNLRWVPDLRDLVILNAPITDEGMASLAAVPHLQVLYLNSTQITDKGLTALSGRTDLLCLELENAAVTDASVALLTELKSLTTLVVSGTKLTAGAVEQLRQALPKATISVD